MTTRATYLDRLAVPVRLAPTLFLASALIALAALAVPLLRAEPGPITSDESLYTAEGLNIARGEGFTYTTGEPVHHRGPVFPALLAADFKLVGFSIDHARWVPKLFALGSAALLLFVAGRLFGREAGLLAAAFGLVSSLLLLMGSSLFLDGAESFFLLLTLLLLYVAIKDERPWLGAPLGGALALAMLTKESALLWLPLPFVAVLLLGPAVAQPRALLASYVAGLLAVAGWWWAYVYAATGDIYLLGEPGAAAVWLGAGAACLVPAALAGAVAHQRRLRPRPEARWALVGLVLAGWWTLFLIGLERHSTWPFPVDYFSTVPDYTTSVLASWLRPLPLVGAAWGYVCYRAARGSLSDRLLLLALLLFLPFALFVANRNLHVRDVLPLAYLSYVALARTAIDFARWLASTLGESLSPALGSVIAAMLVIAAFVWFAMDETQRFSDYRSTFDAEAMRQGNWDNPLVREAAAWVEEHVPPGTPVMSGRLYYSHLYALTGARYPWWQLPTVRVDIEGAPPALERASTLFRWEDHELPDGAGEPWLYLRVYPEKRYLIGLSERDLLDSLREHEIGYLIVTGDDAGFSSLSLLPYFEDHPAFREVQTFRGDAVNQLHVFRVDRSQLALESPPARVSHTTVAALSDELGPKGAHDLLVALSPGGYVVTPSYGEPDGAE